MGDPVSISQEQAEMLEAGVAPALESLLATGNFLPTLYVHDGTSLTFFTLAVLPEVAALHRMARQVIQGLSQEVVAYLLLYDSALDTDDGPIDVLVIETGDADDEDAHEFARMYSRQKQTIGPKMGRLGPAPHLLK